MELPGIERSSVSRWLAERGVPTPVEFSLVSGGRSNLTYRVSDAGGVVRALRRPPTGGVLSTAHDMSREWRFLSALHGTGVPVPEPFAYCEDTEITGASFYVMDFVDGLILRTPAESAGFTPHDYETATDSLVDVQVNFHGLDVDAVGLGDLARNRTNYVARQLRRWKTQVDTARARDLPVIDEVHDELVATVPPEQGQPGLVHGDYRFDNTVLGPDRRVIAVLDWELATIGDPVADFAWSLLYWSDPGDEVRFIDDTPTLDPGFPRSVDVVERYADRSGRDLSALGWYRAFGYWKMGCIVEGVHARRSRGQGAGAPSNTLETIAARADRFLHVADDKARALGL